MGEMPPRTLNDQAQLVASVRTGVYSYQNQGFLVWDPRMGTERPNPETHPGLTAARTDSRPASSSNFATHVTATGERGCGYEASLEAWYRFLIDPEPIATVTADRNHGLSVRGPINNVVLAQRAAFLRPDSLLAIIMLTDENDCSINDENDAQGWLVGRRSADAARLLGVRADPDAAERTAAAVPASIDVPRLPGERERRRVRRRARRSRRSKTARTSAASTRSGASASTCSTPGSATSNGLTSAAHPTARTRAERRDRGHEPALHARRRRHARARPGLVFLAGIVGVPWQDIADDDEPAGRGLHYLTATEMARQGALAPPSTQSLGRDPRRSRHRHGRRPIRS